jgi:diguanylate cyclase (GGDEF)-like protein/PAS domain S-box-containing protein
MEAFLPVNHLKQQVDALREELRECRALIADLRLRETRYRSLVENADEAILVAQNGSFQYANPKAERLFGYSQALLTHRPLLRFIHQADQAMVAQHDENELAGRDFQPERAFRIINQDGQTIWVELKIALFSWSSQPAALWFLTDITRRKQAEDKYRHFLDRRFEAFILVDADRIITEVNNALLTISGYRNEDLIGHRADEFYIDTSVKFYSASPDHFSFEALLRASENRRIPMLFSRSTIKDAQDKISGFMYSLTDLTDLKAAQEELRKAEQQYRSMYQHAVQGMFQSRLDGGLIRVNPSFATILGYDSIEEVLALKKGAYQFYFHPQERAELIKAVQKKGRLVNHELRLKRKDGRPVWILANIRYVQDDTGEAFLEGILIDNTKRKTLEKELRRDRKKFRNLSIHNNLTGLYNTRYLYQKLDQIIEESRLTGKPFSLVFMDMDNFKHVVDTFGHLNGSQALKEVAQTIKSCLQRPCFGVAYGGDEFVVVLPGFDKVHATEKLKQIRARMQQTTYLTKAGHQVHLGASFGLATFPDDTDSREDLLALADQAMFHIKQTGKGAIGVHKA